MHVKLLKELLNLDKSVPKEQERETLKQQLNPSEKNDTSIRQDTNPDDQDISSTLMKVIIDAHEPVNLDLESISDYNDTNSSSSYDSFYDKNF